MREKEIIQPIKGVFPAFIDVCISHKYFALGEYGNPLNCPLYIALKSIVPTWTVNVGIDKVTIQGHTYRIAQVVSKWHPTQVKAWIKAAKNGVQIKNVILTLIKT